MRILELKAENVKRLSVVAIKPDGALVQITGKNGQGKTSVLDSIWWALAGTSNIQAQPIRQGAEKAKIELTLGEGQTASLLVERTFTEKGSYLKVMNAEGFERRSPQQVLDGLLGALSFDPLAFMRSGAKAQFDALKRLVPIDIDLAKLEEDRTLLFDERRDINRKLKELEAQASAIALPPDAPAAEVDTSTLLNELAGVDAHNAKVRDMQREERQAEADAETAAQRANDHRETCAMNIRLRAEHIAKLERELEKAKDHARGLNAKDERLVDELDELAKGARQAADEIKTRVVPALQDPAAISERLKQAELANKKFAKVRERQALDERIQRGQGLADARSQQIEKIDAEKAAAIARAPMPVEGLGFGDGIVTYRGLPLDQASDAEQLKVSTGIAAAGNPTLRVLRIRDGSLLDEEAMTWLEAFATAHNFQIWIERVDSSGEVGVVMEDGHVRGQVLEPTPAAGRRVGAADSDATVAI